MKINPLGIQTYQQITRRENPTPEAARQDDPAAVRSNVAIEPQKQTGSKLAVNGPSGTYADFLTKGEQKAMEMLFARFQESGRIANATAEEKTLGRVVDVKV
jgi:hypothetical protein